jgi:gas vesicle protein
LFVFPDELILFYFILLHCLNNIQNKQSLKFINIRKQQLTLIRIVMSKGKVFLGVLAGVAIGAALGVLFAPDKGWNTRKRISKKAEHLTEDLRDKFEEFIDSISTKVDEAKEEAADYNRKRSSKAKNEAKTANA